MGSRLDLEKFFDRVHHDRLMARLAEKVKDKMILKLIRKYLAIGSHDQWTVMIPRKERRKVVP